MEIKSHLLGGRGLGEAVGRYFTVHISIITYLFVFAIDAYGWGWPQLIDTTIRSIHTAMNCFDFFFAWGICKSCI